MRDFGVREVFISETEALRRQDLGDRGGVQTRARDRWKNLADCLLGGN